MRKAAEERYLHFYLAVTAAKQTVVFVVCLLFFVLSGTNISLTDILRAVEITFSKVSKNKLLPRFNLIQENFSIV